MMSVVLAHLSPEVLIGSFKQLENDIERLRPHLNAELEVAPSVCFSQGKLVSMNFIFLA
jgi:hypothetical protein